jgi:hypothetical protein
VRQRSTPRASDRRGGRDQAQALVGDAEATAAESPVKGDDSTEIQELSRRELLRGDAEALEAYAIAYREKLRETLEADLAALTSGGAVESPTPRPELHEVEIPPAASAAPAPGPAPAPTLALELGLQDPRPRWSPRSRRPRSVPAADWPPPPGTASQSSEAAGAGWLGDDAGSAEPALDAPAPWERDTGHHEPFSSDVPMEASAVDTDSLSDDSSRHSEACVTAPPGPSDDDQRGDFYDRVRRPPPRLPRRRLAHRSLAARSRLRRARSSRASASPSTSSIVAPGRSSPLEAHRDRRCDAVRRCGRAGRPRPPRAIVRSTISKPSALRCSFTSRTVACASAAARRR